MTIGALVHADEVPAEYRAPGASIRTLLATGPARAWPGGWWTSRPARGPMGPPGRAASFGSWSRVLAGLDVADRPGLPVTADLALWIPPGARYQLHADGPADLHVDAVTLPAADAGASARTGRVLVSDLSDCDVETTGDRKFRVLFGPGQGCGTATQFVGEIPPGRAPEHSHPYDELILVLSGRGVLHTGLGDHSIRAGSCAHLPPGQLHCLENTGSALLRVLGVFHPAGSPAAKNGPH